MCLTYVYVCICFFFSGFGFITFKDAESVAKVQRAHSEEPLCIDDKIVSERERERGRVHIVICKSYTVL